MAKLVGELHPRIFASVDDNPSHAAAIEMQPDRGRAEYTSVHANPGRVTIRNQPNSVKAFAPHALDHQMGCAGRYLPPVAREFDWGREERGSTFNRRRKD